MGHIGEEQTKKIAKELGLTISKKRPFCVCTACTLGKIKRKKIVQFNIEHEWAKSNNERVYLDVGWLRPKNKENRLYKPYWRIIVDERTQMKHSAFLTQRREWWNQLVNYFNIGEQQDSQCNMSDWIMLERTKDYSSDQRVLIGNLEYIMNSQMQGPLKEIAWQR